MAGATKNANELFLTRHQRITMNTIEVINAFV